MKNLSAYLAEALGTFALVFFGAGSFLVAVDGAGIGLLGVALAHGLALMMIVYSLGGISGAHVNPAVTFGMWVSGKMPTWEAVKYVVSQLIGSVFAALVLMLLLDPPAAANLGTPEVAKNLSLWQGLFIEGLLTFFLVFAVMSTADKKFPPAASGLTIGLTLTISIFIGGILTGAALNPARAFGPAAVSGTWVNHLIYWAGPLLGALVAALVNRLLRK